MASSRSDADAWVECRCGQRHWGRNGAAGLLLLDPAGTSIVLQHRAEWSHHGGSWGIPGGARLMDEAPILGALRESAEEAGTVTAEIEVRSTSVLEHPDWSYTTVLAQASTPMSVHAADAESQAVRWVPVEEVTSVALLPAFEAAWPMLRRMLSLRLHLVVDLANVMGSRADGWWRDRRGAAERLLSELDLTATHGLSADELDLPGTWWWPRWHAVSEGQARDVGSTPHIDVVEAPGSGDDAIVALVADLVREPTAAVVVVTADRELRARTTAVGARSALGPRTLLQRG